MKLYLMFTVSETEQVYINYPRESFREGLCFYRRWFVCLFVTTIWTKFFGKVPTGKSKPKFVSGYDR